LINKRWNTSLMKFLGSRKLDGLIKPMKKRKREKKKHLRSSAKRYSKLCIAMTIPGHLENQWTRRRCLTIMTLLISLWIWKKFKRTLKKIIIPLGSNLKGTFTKSLRMLELIINRIQSTTNMLMS